MSRPEFEEQRAVAKWLNWNQIFWTHVGHGGVRDAATAGKMKAAGVRPGIPDCLIFEPPPNYPDRAGAAIELKRRDGAPSDIRDEQKEAIMRLEGNGWLVAVCWGSDDAIETLKGWGYGG